jgi:anti-sigma factor RsiW
VLAGTLTLGALHHQTGSEVASEVVSAHIRALMAPAPADVASSDHHTVKPWFNGKLAFAPVVPDLGSQGYPLLGGRIDVIGLEPAASLIYSRGKHIISVTEMPTNGASPSAETSYSERGYMALSWSSGGVSYFAVCDAGGLGFPPPITYTHSENSGGAYGGRPLRRMF